MCHETKDVVLDVGLANELKIAARRAGATNADIKVLASGEMFVKLLPVIRGQAEVVIPKHIIDLSRDALYVPYDWTVEEHNGEGELEWDPDKITLYLSKYQKKGKRIEGNKLRKELKNQLILPANVLDFLLKHLHLIPEVWKGKWIFFWGTIYRSAIGNLCVRYLCWYGGHWDWNYSWLDNDFHSAGPAAVRAS